MCAGTASAVPVPAPLDQLAKDDEVATIDRDHLPVAPAQRPVGPPAVLDEPRFAHGNDLVVVDGERPPPGACEDGGGARDPEAAAAGAHWRAGGAGRAGAERAASAERAAGAER